MAALVDGGGGLLAVARSISLAGEPEDAERAESEFLLSKKPWGGVFDGETDPRVEKFTESVSFDHRLYAHDICGSIAHARMLAARGVLTVAELQQIVDGLEQIGRDIAAGTFSFSTELEDVHMNIERSLTERIGDVGRKLHTGRSRNDQVSTDFRLWIRDGIEEVMNQFNR
jgi:argininosuccinate lyase